MSCRIPLSPTILPAEYFDERADAEALRKAMKGFGTDEATLIRIITSRSREQRLDIALQYKSLFGRDLHEDLYSETSGNFRKTLLGLMKPLRTYYAEELYTAMKGVGTTERTLIDILCTLSNHEIRLVKQEFEKQYQATLESYINGDTSGHFRRLLISLCCANRDETDFVNVSEARLDAQKLYSAGEEILGTDESVFNQIFVTRNYAQLRQIFQEYHTLTGNDIEKAIESEFSGDIRDGLMTIALYAKDRAGFFAERLYKSMKGMGTDDVSLVRVIVSRSEIDMGEIKLAFRRKYAQPLSEWVIDDCSGDYKRCLLAIINENHEL